MMAFFFSRTEPFPELYKKAPQNKLIAARPIGSLLGHMLIIGAVQILTFVYVKSQVWFEAYEDSANKEDKNFSCFENTAVFLVSMFQYVTAAVIFSKGAPYRRSIFSNRKLARAFIPHSLLFNVKKAILDQMWRNWVN